MWLAVCSSIFQLFLAAAGIYVSIKPVKSEHHYWWISGFVVVGLTGVVFNGIQAYSTDKKEQALQIQIDQLLQQSKDTGAGIQHLQKTTEEAQNKPRLVGRIEEVARAEDVSNGVTQVLVLMTISNAGTPSVARGFSLSINRDSLAPIRVFSTAFPEPFIMKDPSGKIISEFTRNDALYEKTTKPIERGGYIIGRLLFLVKDLKVDEFKPGTKLTVSFSDLFGNTYEASFEITGHGYTTSQYYYPGAKKRWWPPNRQSDFLGFFGFALARFFCGGVFMSTSITCSKLSGWSDSGLAFGMRPPWIKNLFASTVEVSTGRDHLAF